MNVVFRFVPQNSSPDHRMDDRACGNLLVMHSPAEDGANPSAEGSVSEAASATSSTVSSRLFLLRGTDVGGACFTPSPLTRYPN